MAGFRTAIPAGTNPFAPRPIDDGTTNRWQTPAPGPLGVRVAVESMSLTDRGLEVLRRTAPRLPAEMRDEFLGMLTPTNLALIAGALAAWAGSHYIGIGFVGDALMMAAGTVLMGRQAWWAAKHLVASLKLMAAARTTADLDESAHHLAAFIAMVGVGVLMALVFKGARRVAPKAKAAIAAAANRLAGMTPGHFRVFQTVARELNRVIVVRNTNPRCTPWIERGFPPKPKSLEGVHTSKTTGIVTAANAAEALKARAAGFYVVDADGVARNSAGQALKFDAKPAWPVESGQVVHPQQLKPVVGDYDLMGVIDPTAPGRNIALAAKDGEMLKNWSSPEVNRVGEAINKHLDQPRVLHGAQDAYYKGKPDLSDAGGCTAFFPDGTVRELPTPADVGAFYQEIGRQPITGKY